MTLSYVNPGTPTYPPRMYPVSSPVRQQYPQWNVPAPPPSYPGYYAMPQYPVYGQQIPYGPRVNNGSPSVSAVKIDINGATVGAGSASQIPSYAPAPRIPMYPGRAQMINPAPQFVPGNMTPPPGYYPSPNTYPAGRYNTPAPPYIMPSQAVGFAPQQQPQIAPVPPQPIINQPAGNIPIPPAAIDQQNNQQTANIPQISSSAPVDQAVLPLSQALNIIIPKPGQQPSFEEQSKAIKIVGQYAKTAQAANTLLKANPKNPSAIQAEQKVKKLVNPLLINENTFKGLASIAVSDTSGLSGEQKQKADENKVTSMWTLAILQKLFRGEMNKELKKENIPPMSINELPGITQIVGNIKADPNPDIRTAGIVALMEVANPKNPKDVQTMKTILNIAAKQDGSEDVRNTAKSALKEFNK